MTQATEPCAPEANRLRPSRLVWPERTRMSSAKESFHFDCSALMLIHGDFWFLGATPAWLPDPIGNVPEEVTDPCPSNHEAAA